MGQKKQVKQEDIAERLGVSIVAVSNALKGKRGVSEELREKIRQTAKELGYQVAKQENSQKKETYMIGVVVAERYVKEFPSFYMELYKQITQEVVKKGHLTVLEVVTPKREQEAQEFTTFLEGEIAGLILIGELGREYICAVREKYRIPVVCVDYYDIYDDMDYIVTDSFGGTEQMTKLLIDQGIRELAFVGVLDASKNIMDRYLGYCKALEKAGIDESQGRVIDDREPGAQDAQISFELPQELPEGFVCNCDKTAVMLIQKLEERGIRVPEDASVVSFDNYYAGLSGERQLSTYENDGHVLTQISVNTLLKRIEGKTQANGVRIVEGKVIPGDTVKFRRKS